MNKNKLFITLSLLLITSCSTQNVSGTVFILSKYHSMDSSLNLMSDGFYNYHPKCDMDALTNVHDLYLSFIEKEDISNIRKCDVELYKAATPFIDNYYLKEAIYTGNPTEKNYSEYLSAYEGIATYSIYQNDIVEAAIESGNEEIIKIVIGEQNLKPCKDPKREAELNVIIKEYADKANILVNNEELYEVDELIKEGVNLFVEFAPYCQELAELYDYDSYLDYAYDYSFHRDYTVKEAELLTSNIKEYVASKYEDMDLSEYSEEDQERITSSVKSSFATNNLNLGHVLDEYASFMGGNYLDIYKEEFNNGCYLFSNNEDCLGTAFTAVLYNKDTPLLFFGNEYQGVSTIVHEFGHCYSLVTYKNTINKSLDINETFSQGNEVLFSSYLQNHYQEDYIKGIGLKNMYSLYIGLLKTSYAVNVENYLFNNYEDLSTDELYDGIQDIYSSYGVSDIKQRYWIYPVIAEPGYYISYVTSCVSSLELYNLALKDFNNAKNIYNNLINQKEIYGEVEAWTKAGFASPFDVNTIKDIAKFFD